MKTLKIFSVILISCCLTATSFAQKAKTETFKVSGECGMCKKKIEKAAKTAGATYAVWDINKKEITVKYNSTSTNTAKIQEAIANTGYDTPGYKANDKAYNDLDDCCKYEREATGKTTDCCAPGMDCCKDGKCTKHDGAVKMDCCKDDKCTKEGHSGNDCCKKS
ncbi:MAG: heavy-metal-associated domain-containing protein [Chitinophagaceae bacterium]|nr:MAG: heavy-metal-associated domain-containing protein [Chitinophagaceae bacterium]